jgi:hypothetical protein
LGLCSRFLPLASNLTLHTDGLLYGDTAIGGANGQGVSFSFNVGFKPPVWLPTSEAG